MDAESITAAFSSVYLGEMLLTLSFLMLFFVVFCFGNVLMMPLEPLVIRGLVVLVVFCLCVSLAGFVVSVRELLLCFLDAGKAAAEGLHTLLEHYQAHVAMG